MVPAGADVVVGMGSPLCAMCSRFIAALLLSAGVADDPDAVDSRAAGYGLRARCYSTPDKRPSDNSGYRRTSQDQWWFPTDAQRVNTRRAFWGRETWDGVFSSGVA